MRNNKVLERLAKIETDLVWVKKLLIGAASLGFVEKAIGWWFK